MGESEADGEKAFRPRVSVVINTLNRGWILDRVIQSLRYQDYPEFELIVVNGPSTDNTEMVLSAIAGQAKIVHVDQPNLSMSRNAGIAASAGEIVLFLDDDAFAESGWISNIVAAFRDPRVAGAGTRVWNHHGFVEQLNPRLVDEFYTPIFDARLPAWAFQDPNSLTIPHILGASSSFSREMLIEIGGFDEEIEYFLDESEVCRRIAERGRHILFIETGAAVLHKYSSGVVRDERKVLSHPYPVVKNKFYVTLSDARRNSGLISRALEAAQRFADELLEGARHNLDTRIISPHEYERFVRDVARGIADGRQRGLTATRRSAVFGPPPTFQRFPTLQPEGGALTFCFVCRHLPQESPGGIAKFVYDLAKGFSARGHHVSVIAQAEGPSEIDYRDGLWLRRLSIADATPIAHDILITLESPVAAENFQWSAMAHAEISRIRDAAPVDLVVVPVWNTEGLHCIADDTLKTVLTLQTTFKTFAEIEWRNLSASTVEELSILERISVERARYVHAISDAIGTQVADSYCPRGDALWGVARLGVDDLATGAVLLPPAADRPVRITYVSRLEARKGTDTFLAAVSKLVMDHPTLVVELAGQDTTTHGGGRGYRALVATLPRSARDRVLFTGQLDDDDLLAAYSNADIFCVPSRYESFGLIYLEAMRAGKPVVACRVGGVPEVVEDGVTGLLVPPDNVSALQAALDQLVRHPAQRAAMGTAGRRRFEDEFTSDKMVDRTLSLYRRMING